MISLLLFFVFLFVLLYVALIYVSRALILLTFMMAAYAVVSLVWLVYIRCTVHCKISVPIAVADEGKEVTVCVKVSNSGRMPHARMKLCLLTEDCFRGRVYKKWVHASRILPGEGDVEYQLMLPQCGSYEVRLHRCRVYEPTGMFAVGVRTARGARIRILPRVCAVAVRLTEPVRNFFGDSDVYDDKNAGPDSSELFQVRPFEDGDRLQSIHWKLSAKSGELVVKEHGLPKACPVVLFLDYRIARGRDCFGNFLKIASSLSFSFMDAGCPHYIAWYEEQTGDIVRIRVDSEEGFYLFLNYYLQDPTTQEHEPLVELYREKYRAQHYIYGFHLDEKLILRRGGEMCADFAHGDVEQQLAGMEIVL